MLGNVNNSCAANHNIMYLTPLYFCCHFGPELVGAWKITIKEVNVY